MANAFTKRVVHEGPRNAVVELIGVLDTNIAAPTEVQQIDLADFTNNDVGIGALAGFRVDTIQYSISDGGYLNFVWEATTDQEIAAIAGRGKMRFTDCHYAAGLQPDQAAAGYTGAIEVLAYAPAATTTNMVYTVLLNMTKLY